MKRWTAALVLLTAAFVGGVSTPVAAQLRWPDPPKRAPIRVRLVAVALAIPRSSFFSSSEIFVAESEIAHDEWHLIKLVFTYLPYQPGLMDSGFDYSVVHELSASRDPNCDETVEQLTARRQPERHEALMYSRHVPKENLDRRRIPLPCYETNADEYITSSLEPIAPPPEPTPFLKERSNLEPDPTVSGPLNPRPTPALGESQYAQPIPFLNGVAKSTPIPLFDDGWKPKLTPSLNGAVNWKPIPFLDEILTARPIPFLSDALTLKPVPLLNVGSTLKPIPFDDGLNPKPIPFLDDGSNGKPVASLNHASRRKPVLFIDDRAQPKPKRRGQQSSSAVH